MQYTFKNSEGDFTEPNQKNTMKRRRKVKRDLPIPTPEKVLLL